MRRTAFLVGLLAVFAAESPQATTWLIKPDGTGDYANIQAGLNAAAAGDTVLLAPGTYLGPPNGVIDWPPRAMVLLSQAGADQTLISGYDLYIENGGPGAADGSTIDGISIVHAPSLGLLCNYSSVTVRNCAFTGNLGNAPSVSLIGNSATSSLVEHCVFWGNRTQAPAIACGGDGSSAVIRFCLFVDNTFGERGVIDINETSPAITNNTFIRNVNVGTDSRYAVLFTCCGGAPIVSYNIIAFTDGGAACNDAGVWGYNAFFTCNDLFANEYGGNVICGTNLGGNFSADPLFCTPGAVDELTIKAGSPCAPEHSPCGQLVGALPVACAECPADRTMSPGARQRFIISLYNNTSTAGWAYYMVQGDPPLTFEMEEELDGFAPSIIGALSIEPHSSVNLAAWVQVAENAVPEDSLQFYIVRGFSTESPDTCAISVRVGSNPVGVGGAKPALRAALIGGVPNPFSSSTRLRYTVPESGGEVTLSVYDAGGRHVRTLVRRAVSAGEHATEWNGLDERGASVPSGVYFGVLRGRGFTVTTKLLLLR